MHVPTTKEEWKQIIHHQKYRFFHEITDKFPWDSIQPLHNTLAAMGKQKWLDWMRGHRGEIVDFLRDVPFQIRSGLDYQNNGLLYLAALYYMRRAVQLLDLLELTWFVDSVAYDSPTYHIRVAEVAEALTMLDKEPPVPMWLLNAPSPFP